MNSRGRFVPPFVLAALVFSQACGGEKSNGMQGGDAGADASASGGTTSGSGGFATGGSSATGGSTGTGGISGTAGAGGNSGGASAEGGSAGSAGAINVDTPPVVTETTPSDGTAGVSDDVVLVVTFSEPMNTSSVEAAYQSDDLPAESVTFAWNSEETELSITPNAPLTYAEGTNLDELVAESYSFTIGTGAEDLTGNALEAQETVTFTTLRRCSEDLNNNASLSGYYRNGAGGNNLFIIAGDEGAEDNRQFKGFFTFDIGDLPDNIQSFEKADLQVTQDTVNSSPYSDLGTLSVHSIIFSSAAQAAFDASSLHELTIPNSATLGQKTVNALAAVSDDYAARDSRTDPYSQYRLEFSKPTDNDGTADQARFDTTATLELTYLVP